MTLFSVNKKIIFFLGVVFIFLSISFLNYNFKNNDKLTIFKNCSLNEIKLVPKNSTIIIGHAYGSPLNANKDSFIAKKIELFFKQNKENINKVIFTGDIFWDPSLEKWNKLYNDYKDIFQIHIAPGNHEFDRLAKIDIFKISKFRSDDYYELKISEIEIYIIENSIINNWEVNPGLIEYLNKNPNYNFTLFRHNIPVQELVQFANSKSLISENLSTVDVLHKKLSNIDNLTIISGDSGAFKELPRSTCHEYKNIKFITNGIGEIKEDQILIISNNKIYSYNLR